MKRQHAFVEIGLVVTLIVLETVSASCGSDSRGEGSGGAGGGGGQPAACLEESKDLPGADDATVSAGQFKRIAVGSFSCGIDSDGHLACWGETGFQTEPPAGTFVDISVGACSACAINTEGRISCWGCQPGDGGFLPPEGRFSSLAMGLDHLCAIRADDDSIACSGSISGGIPDGAFASIVSARHASCAILRGETSKANVRCWGANDNGLATPPEVSAVRLVNGVQHFCAIQPTGDLVCWGLSSSGQTDAPAGTFRMASGTCGIRDDQTIECWGALKESDVPGGCFDQLSAGSTHACGIRADGHVVCWGSNVRGESTPP